MKKSLISAENANFWDELCGTQFANSIGTSDASITSLLKFDHWYFDLYPYLLDHIPLESIQNKDVLEIGLGYGTLSQRIAEMGANYFGLDIAAGPVHMVNHRLKQNGLRGRATIGSVLEAPFSNNSFDTIVAIGCLHHTGDLQKAIDQCYRLLRDGGQLIFMVYYAYSYRRWFRSPFTTINYAIREFKGARDVVAASSTRDRAAYDINSSGVGAPHTDWISKKSLNEYCSNFSEFKSIIENIDRDPPFIFWRRKSLLRTGIPRLMGLDLYACATK
jgi:SAM-dependent methyltransferase